MIRKNLDGFETLQKIENELEKSGHLIRFLLKISGWTRQFPGGDATLLPKISQLCPGDWEPIATFPSVHLHMDGSPRWHNNNEIGNISMQFGTIAFRVIARMGKRRVMQLRIERLMVFVLNISFSPYEEEYEQRMGFPKSSREVSQHILYKSYSSHKQS